MIAAPFDLERNILARLAASPQPMPDSQLLPFGVRLTDYAGTMLGMIAVGYVKVLARGLYEITELGREALEAETEHVHHVS